MKKTIVLLFGMQRRVSRSAYLGWGLSLAALKIAVDTAVVLAMAGRFWSPLAYVLPSVTIRQHDVASGSGAMHALLALWALPFAWIGLTMSIRRAVDAGLSPWTGALFLVPIVNYVMIAILGAMPSKGQMRWEPAPVTGPYRRGGEDAAPPPSSARTVPLPPAVRAALLAPPIGIGMIALCSYAIGQYGFVLFLTTPFAMEPSHRSFTIVRPFDRMGRRLGWRWRSPGDSVCYLRSRAFSAWRWRFRLPLR